MPVNIELFSCAGGMAEGFRQAGIEFDFAFDFAKDHCDSYEKNIGHRPVCMDVRDLLRMARAGLVSGPVGLFVADPPCTPWSMSGLRLGTEDDRDMVVDTCELIRILRPRAFLIGNVPGLDSRKNWHVVQNHIGGLSKHGYCVADFIALDAADYGVPQHRVRPFWFGHLDGPCIQWPRPSHCDPDELATETLPGFERLSPWVNCRQGLAHIPEAERGRPVKLRRRSCNGKQHGSVHERPARVVGTSNLSDGNVLLMSDKHRTSSADEPSMAVTSKQRGNGASVLVFDEHHPPMSEDKPANVIRASNGRGATRSMRKTKATRHEDPDRNHDEDKPARAITTQSRFADNGSLRVSSKHPAVSADDPATTIRGGGKGHSAPALVIQYDTKHPPDDIDKPANTIKASDGGGGKRAMRTRDVGRPGQGMRVGKSSEPGRTVVAGRSHGHSSTCAAPAPTRETFEVMVTADPRIPPPGHHDENWDGGLLSQDGAIVLSERAAAALQGFPDTWHFSGKTQKARWSQIGQAMPIGLSRAVATSVAAQRKAAADTEQPPIPPLATGKLSVV